jgi:taurine dioxygenase
MAGTTSQVAAPGKASFTLRPLAPSFGAEVLGLDLRQPIAGPTADLLRDAFRRCRLLILRDQDISPEDQSRFGRLFGEIFLREHGRVKPKNENELFVSNVRPDGLFGDAELAFHLDHIFYDEPLSALMLYGVEVPVEGGETCFCDTAAVLDALPIELKRRISERSCRHVRAYDEAVAARYNVASEKEESSTAIHPIVWTDAETGRKAIWVNRRWSVEVLGLPLEESAALLGEVRQHIESSSATYCHAWRPGDLVLWNNRLLQHARRPFDPSTRRTLRRTPIMARSGGS